MIEPLGNRVLVEAIEEKKKDMGIEGLIIPDQVQKDRPSKYTIIALGSGDDLAEMKLEIGDVIVMNKFAGSDVKDLDDKEYKIVLHGDIQGRVK